MASKIEENKKTAKTVSAKTAKTASKRSPRSKEKATVVENKPKRSYVRKSKKVGLVVRNIVNDKETIDTVKAVKDKTKLLIAKEDMNVIPEKEPKKQASVIAKDLPMPITKPRVLKERKEEDKRFIMWIGVSFFMILIIIFWFFSTKETIEKSKKDLLPSDSALEWDRMADELGRQISEIKAGVAQVKNFASSTEDLTGERTVDNPLFRQEGGEAVPVEDELIDDLKQELEAKVLDSVEPSAPYLSLSEVEKTEFLSILGNIKPESSLSEVRALLGEADYSEELRDKNANFVSTILDYIIRQEEKGQLDPERDSFVRLVFDKRGTLMKIEKMLK